MFAFFVTFLWCACKKIRIYSHLQDDWTTRKPEKVILVVIPFPSTISSCAFEYWAHSQLSGVKQLKSNDFYVGWYIQIYIYMHIYIYIYIYINAWHIYSKETNYLQKAILLAQHFIHDCNNPDSNVNYGQGKEWRHMKNLHILRWTYDAGHICNMQGLSLRGHRDNWVK